MNANDDDKQIGDSTAAVEPPDEDEPVTADDRGYAAMVETADNRRGHGTFSTLADETGISEFEVARSAARGELSALISARDALRGRAAESLPMSRQVQIQNRRFDPSQVDEMRAERRERSRAEAAIRVLRGEVEAFEARGLRTRADRREAVELWAAITEQRRLLARRVLEGGR